MDAVVPDHELTPTMTAAAEARAWLAQFQAHNTEGAALFAMLKDADRVRVANWVRAQLAGPVCDPSATRSGSPAAAARVRMLATRLYYATAERELRVALASGTAPGALAEVLAEPRLCAAGLAAVVELAQWATGGVATFPAATVRLGALQDGVHVWDACRAVWRVLDEAGAPPAVGVCLAYMAARLEEELAFGPGASLYDLFGAYHAGGLGVRDAGLVEDFFEAVHARLRVRCVRAATALVAAPRGGGAGLPNSSPETCTLVADALFAERTELLFGPHMSATVVCVLYGTARGLDVPVHLRAVTAAVHAAAPHTGPGAAETVELWADAAPPGPRAPPAPARLDVRAYYNHHFVGPMKAALRRVVAEAGGPASPACGATSPAAVAARGGVSLARAASAPAGPAKRGRMPLAALTAKDMADR